jgi:two-component system CheB/CheR fusion protein
MRIGQTIQRTVRSQARIIDDLLDLSRLRTGKLVLNPVPLALGDALETSIDWARAQATAKGIHFSTELATTALMVHADPVRVEQVAMNLLGNAIKFCDAGARIVVRTGQDGNDALFEVRDSGCGIESDLLPQIFELYKQGVVQAGAAGESGLGIGLALVHKLVTLHGGRIDASSGGKGQGSVFTVRLPLQAASGAPSSPAAPQGALAGLRVLYVDDTLDTLESFTELLRLEGVEVLAANSGAEALRLAERETVDLVISDIGMPDMDGYQLIAALRERPASANIPAVALTGYGREQDIQRALAAGFNVHIGKPIELEKLEAVVRKLGLRAG